MNIFNMSIKEVWHVGESKIISHFGKYNYKTMSKPLLCMRMLGPKNWKLDICQQNYGITHLPFET